MWYVAIDLTDEFLFTLIPKREEHQNKFAFMWKRYCYMLALTQGDDFLLSVTIYFNILDILYKKNGVTILMISCSPDMCSNKWQVLQMS